MEFSLPPFAIQSDAFLAGAAREERTLLRWLFIPSTECWALLFRRIKESDIERERESVMTDVGIFEIGIAKIYFFFYYGVYERRGYSGKSLQMK